MTLYKNKFTWNNICARDLIVLESTSSGRHHSGSIQLRE